MSTRYVEARDVYPGATADAAKNVREVYVDTDNEIFKKYDKTNSVWRPAGHPFAKSYTASATLVLEDSSQPILVNAAAGLTLTLPVAVGSGAKFKIYIGTLLTSNSFILACAGSDKFYGGVFLNDTGLSGAATVDFWPASAGSSATFTLAQSLGLGVIGDWIEVTDIGALQWVVNGVIAGNVDLSSGGSMWS
jgi:hypothetical protein